MTRETYFGHVYRRVRLSTLLVANSIEHELNNLLLLKVVIRLIWVESFWGLVNVGGSSGSGGECVQELL